MPETNAPTDLFHWLLGVSPIVVVLVLLAVLRRTLPWAGAVGFLIGAETHALFAV